MTTDKDTNKIFFDSVSLFNKSEYHRVYTVRDLQTYLLLPMRYRTIRVFYRGEEPVGLATWCWMAKENADKFLVGEYHPNADDFNPDMRDGKELWGMEFIAPYGDTRSLMSLLNQECLNLYGKQEVHWRRSYDMTKKRKGKFK